MTPLQYERISNALNTLSGDESEMITFALIHLKNSNFYEPVWKTAQKKAAEFLAMRCEAHLE